MTVSAYKPVRIYTIYKQGTAIMVHNRTGPPCSVGRSTAHAPGPAAAKPGPPSGSITDDDRRCRQTTDASKQSNTGPLRYFRPIYPIFCRLPLWRSQAIQLQRLANRPVRGADDEHVLLATHSIHLGEQLIDDSVSRTAAITDTSTTRLGNWVQLIKEQNAWSCGTRLQRTQSRSQMSVCPCVHTCVHPQNVWLISMTFGQ